MASRGGRPVRGNRESTSFAAPAEHLALYRAEAAAAGIPLGDYLSIRLAERHDLPLPAYLVKPTPDQQELPLGA